jgi:hypothetical protein
MQKIHNPSSEKRVKQCPRWPTGVKRASTTEVASFE